MKCKEDGCNRAVCLIGDCRYCDGKFCLKHRLPETHACNLANVKSGGQIVLYQGCDKMNKMIPRI